MATTTLKKLEGLHIEGRRWFNRGPGNTYHSVTIYANGGTLVYLPYQYGYDDGYLQTALDWLAANGYIPAAEGYPLPNGYCVAKEHGTYYIREELHGTYSVTDVQRKKDL